MGLMDLFDRGEGCWTWHGTVTSQGYGYFHRTRGTRVAHRLVYERLVGPIAEGMDLDHVCHNADVACAGGNTCQHRRCVRPNHLEPVTSPVNVKRGRGANRTHCKWGHQFTPANTYVRKDGGRMCRKCIYRNVRKAILKRRAEDPTYILRE